MGKSSKFYKKPSLKEKQAAQGKVRSSAATASTSSAPVFKQVAIQKAALTGKALEKRQILEQRSRQKEEATRAAKPVFRQAATSSTPTTASRFEQDQGEDDADMVEDDAEVIKRRPRNRQRKDWGPMPKEMGIDYMKQWDSRRS
ncbi:uncharacterized protein SPSC_04567 [Sporisorium scitamineum]|uniref:Uncharacterized protein n=1 Tax=Sporisorium scitamineum TaxID=49012 RepID=A0A0F7RUZ2_9BASI|nr:hypothetical protein [Sporisorium scitamineum]CDU24734.1 uncharacterized protein SPSC_04567 [Sporisorium scitamineum]